MIKLAVGIDVLEAEGFAGLNGAKAGLLVNQASVNKNLCHTIEVFKSQQKCKLISLFGPQHGIWGQTQDNMIEWEGFTDPYWQLPVYSLYGKVRQPTSEMLEGIDTMVIDLPDVGSRYYTFIWTAVLVMKACVQKKIKVVVLDRPNPIGQYCEGPVLREEFSSFVGLYPLAIRHGMTFGEMLAMFNHVHRINCSLEVVKMKNWQSRLYLDETDCPWVMPSPNMPALDTALVYPGFCLLEGTNLSEGRGTTRPFEIFGAPFINPYELVKKLAEENLAGIFFRPLYFKPTFQKFKDEICGGAQLHVTDRAAFKPFKTAVAVLKSVLELYGESFKWKAPPYEYEHTKLPIDILAGNSLLRLQLEEGIPLAEMEDAWNRELEKFALTSAEYKFDEYNSLVSIS